MRFLWELVKRTTKGFYVARGPTMASSISYFALSTFAPLAVVTLWIGGTVLGLGSVRAPLSALLVAVLGPRLGRQTVLLITAESSKSPRQIAAIVAILFLIYAAGSLFLAIQHALDAMWRVRLQPKTDLWRHIVLRAMVVFIAVFVPSVILFIAAITRSVYLGVVRSPQVPSPSPAVYSFGREVLVVLAGWALITLLFATLPDGKMQFRSLLVGSGFAALTIWLGTRALLLYLTVFTPLGRFEIAGSLVALLIWLFVIAQLLLAGARLSYEHACLVSKGVEPRPWAELYEKVPTDEPPTADQEQRAQPA